MKLQNFNLNFLTHIFTYIYLNFHNIYFPEQLSFLYYKSYSRNILFPYMAIAICKILV